MKTKIILYSILLLSSIQLSGQSDIQQYIPDPDPRIRQRIEEWRDIKFGLLMHWGPYSQWGIVESWSICPEDEGWCIPDTVKDYFTYKKRYENLGKTFNPVKFEPDKWAKAAKEAGMKYMVFTTKHHDGFCMFDTKYTDYKITGTDCPFHSNPSADVTKEIFNAFREQGLWIGAYFSKPDWHSNEYWWPQFPPFDRNVNYDPEKYPEKWSQFVEFTHNQVMELCSNYGKIDLFWFDGGQVQKHEAKDETPIVHGYSVKKLYNQDIKMDELVKKIRLKQPDALVVDRAVEGKNQNYLTPENTVPDAMLPYPWESCIIMGGGWSFSYHAVMKPSRQLIHMLIDIVAKGGNLLLNIGPGPDGTWYDQAYDRLYDMGNWLKINGDAIYGTRPISPYVDGEIRYTRGKDGSIYAIYLIDETEKELPSELVLTGIHPAVKATLNILGIEKSRLKWRNDGVRCTITIPSAIKEKIPSKYAFVVRISSLSTSVFNPNDID